MVASASALRARRSDSRMAASIVSYRRVEWAIDSFAHTKVQEWSAYSRPCYKDGELLSLTGSKFSVPTCLLATYQPCGVRLRKCFMPKPSRYSHRVRRDFRPISLTPFLLNTMERLVDRYF
jgi:hypothetical protein